MASYPKILISAYALFICISCSDRSSTAYQTEFTNNSGYSITITPYYFGAIVTDQVITMAPAEQQTVYVNSERGISDVGFCYGNGVAADSFIVTFNGLYSMAHYAYNISTANPKSYDYTNVRNIRNIDNYELIKEDPKKKRRKLRYLYTFTAQDYLDAQ